MKALILSRPYFTRIPDQSVILSETGEGSAHVTATRDRTGSYAMVYVPEGNPITIDLLKISGPTAVAWWYDPRTGSATRVDENLQTNRARRFTPPSKGRGNDWVLVIDDASKNFSAPGAPTDASPHDS